MLNDVLELFKLREFSNYRGKYFYPDTPKTCIDKKYFFSYPFEVSYSFNSIGYRDSEWPDSLHELENSIWCLGDSGTTGLGAPVEHCWPYVLSQISGVRCLNLSLKGASNFWIYRQLIKIFENFSPKNIIINWTFLHRREISDLEARENIWKRIYPEIKKNDWPKIPSMEFYDSLTYEIKKEIEKSHSFDISGYVPQAEKLSLYPCLDDSENTELIFHFIRETEKIKRNCNVLHTFVPEFTNINHRDTFSKKIKDEFKFDLLKIDQVDLARDGRHWDIKTSENFCKKINHLIK